jgi:hypothetical protein
LRQSVRAADDLAPALAACRHGSRTEQLTTTFMLHRRFNAGMQKQDKENRERTP